MKILGKVSNYDQIIAYLKDPDGEKSSLTLHQQHAVDMWMEGFTLMRNGHSQTDAAAILRKRFDISRATANRYCVLGINAMGDVSKASKDGIRYLATEMIRDAYAIAKVKNNEVAMIMAADKMASINGVNNVDPDLPDFSKLEPNTYNVTLPQNIIAALQVMISGGQINLNGLVTEMANHADDAHVISEDGSD